MVSPPLTSMRALESTVVVAKLLRDAFIRVLDEPAGRGFPDGEVQQRVLDRG